MENGKPKIQKNSIFDFTFSIFRYLPCFSALVILFFISANIFAQELPDKIRG